VTAESLYNDLVSDRSYWISRGKQAASLTIPYLMPREDPLPNDSPDLELPWNGVGQAGISNLASRLLMALLPPTEPFFRLTIDEVEMARITADRQDKDEVAQERAAFDKALNVLERAMLAKIAHSNDRPVLHEGLLQLLVVGNVLAYRPKEGLRMYGLGRYTLKREPTGRPSLAVICEQLTVKSLSEAARKIHEEMVGKQAEDEDGEKRMGLGGHGKIVKVYTEIEWDWNGGRVTWHQELHGKRIEGTDGRAPMDESPWIPLRMYHLDGQDYSPGFVEAVCMADLHTGDVLNQAIAEGALISARCIFGIKPNSQVTPKQFTDAMNGAAITAMPDDVFPIQVGKSADLAVAAQAEQRISARLSQAMLLQNFRDSERTTAQEVRLQALQLENALGSLYSILTVEFQHPYVRRMLALQTREGELPTLDKKLVKPVVSVGLAAVGRGNDLERISQFVGMLSQLLGPEAIPQFLKVPRLVTQMATASNLPNLDAIKTEQEVMEEQQAAQEQQQQMAMAQAAMTSPAADPAKQAQAAQTMQEVAAGPPDDGQPIPE
jgi:hypothetical protein